MRKWQDYFSDFDKFKIAISSEGAETEAKFNTSLIKKSKVACRMESFERDICDFKIQKKEAKQKAKSNFEEKM